MTKVKLAISVILVLVVAVGIVVWRTSRGGHDFHGPSAIVQAATLLEEEEGCPGEMDLQMSRIPVGPHGPPGTFFQTFGELPESGALASCSERIGGYIGWFRFASAKAMDGALDRHPDMTERRQACTHGRELLTASWVDRRTFDSEYCHQVGFAVFSSTR
ncbi:MAG TPA: hypothetical protein VJ204_06765 [Solirubrobacterales bacterium]|nr:hypothetical protein [Solirubrobacterales bacterium]